MKNPYSYALVALLCVACGSVHKSVNTASRAVDSTASSDHNKSRSVQADSAGVQSTTDSVHRLITAEFKEMVISEDYQPVVTDSAGIQAVHTVLLHREIREGSGNKLEQEATTGKTVARVDLHTIKKTANDSVGTFSLQSAAKSYIKSVSRLTLVPWWVFLVAGLLLVFFCYYKRSALSTVLSKASTFFSSKG
jgi:hypothetical protein